MRGLGTLLAVLGAALAMPAAASATLVMTGDTTTHPGLVGLTVYTSPEMASVEAGEVVRGSYHRRVRFRLAATGDLRVGTAPAVARWRCDRRTRVFRAVGRRKDGQVERTTFSVRTPSCRKRLRVTVPSRVRPGSTVTMSVRDEWGIGGLRMRLCMTPPGGPRECGPLPMPAGTTSLSGEFHAPETRGRWRVSLRWGSRRITRIVGVGVRPPRREARRLPTVLTTGDSMMQTLDTVLEDRLEGRANLISDVRIGSGLTKPFIVDWTTLPGEQVRDTRPDAVIVFLGANEDDALDRIPCCGERWVARYAERARAMMRTYLRGGRGAVLWLKNPVPGDERRAPSMAAVNVAVERAARGLKRVRILDTEALFTPAGVYVPSLEIDGTTIRVRQDDMIHLTIPAARIAARPVLRALSELGIL